VLEDVGNFSDLRRREGKSRPFCVFVEVCGYERFCLGDVSLYPEFESGLHVYEDAVAVSYV